MFPSRIFRLQTSSRLLNFCRLYQTGVATTKEIANIEPSDDTLQNLKSAGTTTEIFNILESIPKTPSSDQIMQSFRTLFQLQKSGAPANQTNELINHPQFEQLCNNLRKVSRTLEVNEIIDALKVLSYIGVPGNTNIIHILLNLLRRQINDVTLGHIIFLEFLLTKLDKSPLVEALQMALPMIFQIQLKSQIDHENVPQLIDMLSFTTRNKTSDQCTTSIISALTLHGSNFKVEEAAAIIRFLCDLRPYKPMFERLINNCYKILKKDYRKLNFDDLDRTILKITEQVFKNDVFYDEEFCNNCAIYAVELDVGFNRACFILKKLNKINFVNYNLLDYMTNKIHQGSFDITEAKPSIFFPFIAGLSTASYKSEQWNNIKSKILKNSILKSDRFDLPWMKVACELMSLDCIDNALLDKVFEDNFLEKYLSREQNTLDYLQLLSLYQSTLILNDGYSGRLPSSRFINKAIEFNIERHTSSLKSSLEYIFSSSKYVYTKVTTKYGHLIDHVIVFNENNELVPVDNEEGSESELFQLEKIQKEGQQLVGVQCLPPSHYVFNFPRAKGIFNLKIRTLEALGLIVVPINFKQWSDFPEEEKLSYLEREIKFNLKKI